MNWYLSVLKKYAEFNGRAQRAEYWYFTLFNVIVTIILMLIDNMLGTFNKISSMGLLSGIYTLAVFIPAVAVAIRRLHDTGRSGWWLLLTLIPIIGPIVLFVFFVQESKEANQYGLNPKAV